jgi:IS30 family transposase
MGKQFNHLDQSKRDRIRALQDEGYGVRKIGRTLGIPHSTVSRELVRNSHGEDGRTHPTKQGLYDPATAQHKAYVRRKYAKYQGKKIQENINLRTLIIAKLELHWGPDEIAGFLKKHSNCTTASCLAYDIGSGCSEGVIYVSKTSIYEWLRSEWGQAYCIHLYSGRYRKKTRKPKTTERVMIPHRVSIHDRPSTIDDRSEAGHWEKDAIVSSKTSQGKASLSVDQERLSRLLNACVVPNMKPSEHIKTAKELAEQVTVHSVTYDNGIENKEHTQLAELGIPTYFTDPYSSWQKGGVENVNNMLRRYFPKDTNFDTITQESVTEAIRLINRKPRRILGYTSALQTANDKGVLRVGGAFRG